MTSPGVLSGLGYLLTLNMPIETGSTVIKDKKERSVPNRLQRHRSMSLPCNDDGLSVIEMVVAIGVTMVVLLSSGAAFVRMGEAQRSAEGADRGTQMIQDKLETIRKLPYDLVGCYGDDKYPPVTGASVCPVNVPQTNPSSPVNSSNGERVVNLGPTRPVLDPSGVSPVAIQDAVIGGAAGNKYRVTTVVTWADLSIPGRTFALTPAATAVPPYAAKRVTVTASWTLGTKTRSVTRQWLRSPTPVEVVPVSVGNDAPGSHCPETVPFCTIRITQGQVFTDLTHSKPVVLTMTISIVATKAEVTVGTATATITPDLNSEGVSDGVNFTYTIPAYLVKPGTNTVGIKVFTDKGNKTANKVVNWRFPISTDYELTTPTGFADQSRVEANTDDPTTGLEPPRLSLCVGTDKKLLRYTGVKFNEVAVDDTDGGATPPTIYATGMDASGPYWNLTHILTNADHPQNVGVAGSGYVGTRLTGPGALNTITWSYGFQPDTEFTGAFVGNYSSTSVTISGVRPGDGASATTTLVMPVVKVANLAACGALP